MALYNFMKFINRVILDCFSTSAMSLLYECINTVIAGKWMVFHFLNVPNKKLLFFYMFTCYIHLMKLFLPTDVSSHRNLIVFACL